MFNQIGKIQILLGLVLMGVGIYLLFLTIHQFTGLLIILSSILVILLGFESIKLEEMDKALDELIEKLKKNG